MNRYLVDHLLTDENTLYQPGVVDVSEGRIRYAGPPDQAPPDQAAASVERLSGLLIPGLVNAHAHTPMVLLRGAGEGLPVDRWLTEVIWPREGKLTSEDVWWGMSLGAAELLRNGITTSQEMYFFSETVAEAAVAAGLRCVVTPPVLVGGDLAGFGSWEDQLQAMVEQARRWTGHPLVSVGAGPHSAYALPEETLRRVAEVATAEDLHVHIHLAEAEHEGDEILRVHGVTVPRYLAGLGMLDTRVVAAHGVWLTDEDIELLAAREVGIVHCPASNGKHASGIARVADLREAGIPVAIATDGPSSHDRLDLFEEMRLAIRYARLRAKDASALGPREAFRMVTAEAAAVLGRDDLGRLHPGCRADMVLVDSEGFVPITEPSDLITHLVYSGGPETVKKVWVEGRLVVDGGRVLTVDLDEARRQVTARAVRLAEG